MGRRFGFCVASISEFQRCLPSERDLDFTEAPATEETAFPLKSAAALMNYQLRIRLCPLSRNFPYYVRVCEEISFIETLFYSSQYLTRVTIV